MSSSEVSNGSVEPPRESAPVRKALDPGASEFVPTGRTVLPLQPPMMAMPHVLHPGVLMHHPGMPMSMPPSPAMAFIPPGMPIPSEGGAHPHHHPWPMMTMPMGGPPMSMPMVPGQVMPPPPHPHWVPWMYGSSPPPPMIPHPQHPPPAMPPPQAIPPPIPFSPPPPPPPRCSSSSAVATPSSPNFPTSPAEKSPNAGRQLLAMLNSSAPSTKAVTDASSVHKVEQATTA